MDCAVRIGVLFTQTGPYGAMGRDGRDGARLAIAELVQEHPGFIEPVIVDPRGDIKKYHEAARFMLRDAGCRHIVGTITSLARKELIPVIEKYDGLLWYMCPYEGFEASESVIYTGACPNQHLLPLFDYLLPRYGRHPYLIGANYVWGWEMNHLARRLVDEAGGGVLGERYLSLEETAVGRIVDEIARCRPSFILNNLIGPSSYAFLKAMHALGLRDSAFLPDRCPVVSCDLTECELGEISPAAVGQLAAAPYFDAVASPENDDFKARAARFFGAGRRISNYMAGGYTAVRLCAEAIIKARSDEPEAVRERLSQEPQPTVYGTIRTDPDTHHVPLPFHLGRINETGGFDIVTSRPAVAADPYLTGRSIRWPSKLRVVS